MEVTLHYSPEKPYYSCEVVVFHKNKMGEIYHIANVYYSAKYGMFNCHDFYLTDEADEGCSYGDDIACWCYMDELNVEVLRCLKDLK